MSSVSPKFSQNGPRALRVPKEISWYLDYMVSYVLDHHLMQAIRIFCTSVEDDVYSRACAAGIATHIHTFFAAACSNVHSSSEVQIDSY